MGIPEVPDQVRRAPTEVLRAVFAGIGRILLTADRPPSPAAPEPQPAAPASQDPVESAVSGPGSVQSAAADSRWRSLDQTGNVRLLSAEEMAERAAQAAVKGAPVSPEAAAAPGNANSAAASRPATASTSATLGPAPTPDDALPLANYDTLSLPSIRARLRGLDVGQLRMLAEYEARNAERTEVLGMLERRIQKLAAGALDTGALDTGA